MQRKLKQTKNEGKIAWNTLRGKQNETYNKVKFMHDRR